MRIFAEIRWLMLGICLQVQSLGCGRADIDRAQEGEEPDIQIATMSQIPDLGESSDSTEFTSSEEHGSDTSTVEQESGEESETSSSLGYQIGGSVNHLAGGSLWLDLNDKESLEITTNGKFTFNTRVFDNKSYRVKVLIHPSTPKQQCTVRGGEGVVYGADVDRVQLDCHVPIRYVVVLVVSGLAGEFVNETTMPYLFSLKNEAIYTWSMQSAMPSKGAPNWVALTSGQEPQSIGVTDEFPDPPGRGGIPSIFSKIREGFPTRKIGVFYQDPKFVRILTPSDVDMLVQGKNGNSILDQASDWMADSSPILLMIQLAEIKNIAKVHGWESPMTGAGVTQIDQQIGEFVVTLRNSHFGKNLGLIIAGDHGGYKTTFGGDRAIERSVPLLVMGPQITPTLLDREIRTWDIAATVVDQLQLLASSVPGDLGISVLKEAQRAGDGESEEDVELQLSSVMTGSYLRLYSSERLGTDKTITIWRPAKRPGYASVGDVVADGPDEPDFISLMVRDDASLVALPLGYELIWNDEGSSNLIELGLWNPIPPLGYICLGSVATLERNVAPSREEIRCVHSRFLKPANKQLVWTNAGVDTNWPAGIWRCKGFAEQPIFPPTFRIRRFDQEDESVYPRCFSFDSTKVEVD